MKNEEWGFWIILGVLGLLAYAAGSAIQQAVGPTAGGSIPTGDNVTPQQIQASGLDTSKYDSIVYSVAATFGVPVEWIKAVIGQESSFRENPPVRAGDPSYGLMQITPATARGLGFAGTIPEGLLDPNTNIYLGTALIAQIRQSVGDDFSAMYSAYNSGNAHNYLTNPVVAANVQKAQAWLDFFTSASA